MDEKYKVDAETAAVEFDRFLDCMDIDADVDSMDDEDRKGFSMQKNTVIMAIRRGSLIIDDDGQPVFTPVASDNRDPITFYEPTGAAYMAQDRKKKGQDMAKMYAIMGEVTKQHPGVFAKMKNRDVKVCQAIMTLFLG